MAVFSSSSPGMIESIAPFNAFCMSNQTDFYHANGIFEMFYFMTPYINYNGKKVFPSKGEIPVKTDKKDIADIIKYKLTFDLPDKKQIFLEVKNTFKRTPDKSVEIEMRSDELPNDTKLCYQFWGSDRIFGRFANARDLKNMHTPAGEVKIFSDNDIFSVKEPGTTNGNALSKMDKVKFWTESSNSNLSIAFTLPLGAAGAPQPETLNYTWRPSTADSGDPGVAPFKMSDLELLEEIDCGNPDDPHKFYDSSNDPVIDAERKKCGSLTGNGMNFSYGMLPFADKPQEGIIPVQKIAGEKCRSIPDKRGVYFRYDLNTKLATRTPYLVVVEHVFDKLRRGEFHSIVLDEKNNIINTSRSILNGGFETSATAGSKIKTESVFCYNTALLFPKSGRSSIVFSNVWASGSGWDKAPGPAVKNIKLYRVKTMPEMPDLSRLSPSYEKQRTLTVLTEGPDPWWFFQWPRLAGYNGAVSYAAPSAKFFGGVYSITQSTSFHSGSFYGNKMLFAAAAEQGLYTNLHLGQILHMAFSGTDYDSFTGSFHHSYWGENIPFKPSEDELAHIASALKRVLPELAKYRSLRDISLADNPQWLSVWTERNIRDFCADTGVNIQGSPLYIENANMLVKGDSEILKKWMHWACAERFKFHKWLLSEVRKYRSDLYVTINRCWYTDSVSNFESFYEPVFGLSRARFDKAGINNYDDFLRFMGINAEFYSTESGFSFELESGASLRTDKELPDYYKTDWFNRMGKDFAKGGLSIMQNYCYDEGPVPLKSWICNFFAERNKYRRGLVEALLYANARNITLPTYEEPWRGRIDDLREFAVPYRLLPFEQPVPFEGKIKDTASQAVIKKYGGRYGLINAGDKETVAELELPAGKTSITDLSSGIPKKLDMKNERVKITMSPWSLKTLEIQ